MVPLFGRFWQLLFPPKCVLCRRVLDEPAELCPECGKTDRWAPSAKRKLHFLDSHTAIWYYEDHPRRAILAYKFHRERHLGRKLGRLLAAHLSGKGIPPVDCIAWVPISSLRRLERGYDQASVIAQEAGRLLGLPVLPLLKKTRHTRRQSSLDAAQRRANVLGAFTLTKGQDVRGRRILLIDDVLTTGATAGECARVLLTGGAKEVHCAAVAASRKL